MREGGLPGLNQKFTITSQDPETKQGADFDFYLKLAWYESRLDYVDITLSGLQAHNIRALIELLCKEAYALLRSEVWSTDRLIQEWRGYSFEPSGFCPQLLALEEPNPIARSPIDAAARLISYRRTRWES
ncbi:MAG: hypothetical protein ACYTBJ_00255 [Planctomycetota bacterium]|jgi:hypothetical protein